MVFPKQVKKKYIEFSSSCTASQTGPRNPGESLTTTDHPPTPSSTSGSPPPKARRHHPGSAC